MAVALAFDSYDLPPHRHGGTPPPAQLGPYVVLDRIADGGMASIFRGQNAHTGAFVALKTIHTDDVCQVEGLERETAMLRRLRHPGIVGLVDDGSFGGRPWMALELLEGNTLFEEIARLWRGRPEDADRARPSRSFRPRMAGRSPVPPIGGDSLAWTALLDSDPALVRPRRRPGAGNLRTALMLATRLAPALDYIHDRGVVHRDVKPENVIVAADGHQTLLDFGLACWPRQRARTEPKRWSLGTVEYSAPEQIRGERVDAGADLYSYGCILYELVTGQRLFDGTSPDDIAMKHLRCDPRPPSELVAGLSWRLEDLMLSLLAKDPGRRPSRAGRVAAELTRLAPAASPPS